MRIILLGTGTSHGIPMIGCDCAVCTSSDPRDKRTRTSIIVQTAETSILIDTPPELRVQCLACNIRRVDGILYTHQHADHITGLDDLRRFNALQQTALSCYANPHTAHVLQRMFPYAFTNDPAYPSAKPELNLAEIDGPFEIRGIPVTPIPLLHGHMPVLGFRIGRVAYCTDCSTIPEASMELLTGLDVLVLDALRIRPHPTHFNLEQAVQAAGLIGAKQTYFTHIAHELPHAQTNAGLPDNMALGYDGQIIDLV
jgi:phosphoribosyl 1,2-cyclic phosphate phosphodiesterase